MKLDRNNCAFIVGVFQEIRGAKFRMQNHYFDANENYLGSIEDGKVVHYERNDAPTPVQAVERTTVIRGMDRSPQKQEENPRLKEFEEWVHSLSGVKGRAELMKYCKEHLEFSPEITVKLTKLKDMAIRMFETKDAA